MSKTSQTPDRHSTPPDKDSPRLDKVVCYVITASKPNSVSVAPRETQSNTGTTVRGQE